MNDAGNEFASLVRAESQWKNLPDDDTEGKTSADSKYDALLYIRDAGSITADQLDQLAPVLKTAVERATHRSSNYLRSANGRVLKRRLMANKDAHTLVLELNQLVELGRTAYEAPYALTDQMSTLFGHMTRGASIYDEADRSGTLDQVLDWADRWVGYHQIICPSYLT